MDDRTCNTWVFCPEPRCWTKDRFNHTYGECWLKHLPDLSMARQDNNGAFPEAFRRKHKTAPRLVPWMSGVIHAARTQ